MHNAHNGMHINSVPYNFQLLLPSNLTIARLEDKEHGYANYILQQNDPINNLVHI